MNEKDFRELLGALDAALERFPERPTDPGFDLAVYEKLRLARETLIRAQRDLRSETPKKRDSRSPLGSV